MVFRLRLASLDAHAGELIADDQITSAAGYKDRRYFLGKCYASATRTVVHSGGITSNHNGLAHWWQVGRQIITHPDSAQAVAAVLKERQRAQVWTYCRSGTTWQTPAVA